MFFNLAVCPSGWVALSAAEGRYIVGKLPGGTLGGTAGTPLADKENRAVGQHTHAVIDPGHSHYARTVAGPGTPAGANPVADVAFVSGNLTNITNATGPSGTGITLQDSGAVPGTNAPYIQLLVCVKT